MNSKMLSMMKDGTVKHKQGDLSGAQRCYYAVLEEGPHAGASILLANVLLARAASASETLSIEERVSLRSSSLPLARQSLEGIEKRGVEEQKKLWCRYAYYLLALCGLIKAEGSVHGDAAVAGLPPSSEKEALLEEAISSLQTVTKLDPGYHLAWRNLGMALTGVGRHEEAEVAMGFAVSSCPSPVSWDTYYKHGKCLKRLGREAEALGRYGDAVEASDGQQELPLFWLRVALAEVSSGSAKHASLPIPLGERLNALVLRYGGGASAPPPDSYIRKLFDGYATHFDSHLVGVLGYKTPTAMRARVLEESGDYPKPQWHRCADLGCGTGLAGLAFRDLVSGAMEGCDLSPAMIVEASRRDLYLSVEAAEAVAWLERKRGEGDWFDLVLCADVVVYIGDLGPLFRGVRGVLKRVEGVGEGRPPPPRFVFSTETLLGGVGATFRLTGTGRCQHCSEYIRRLAEECGLRVVAQRRQAIRENAGVPVTGDLWLLSPS